MTKQPEHEDEDHVEAQIRRALDRAGPVGLSACALAGRVGLKRQPLVEVLAEMERSGRVENHSRPGLGGGQWRLVEDEEVSGV